MRVDDDEPRTTITLQKLRASYLIVLEDSEIKLKIFHKFKKSEPEDNVVMIFLSLSNNQGIASE